ncbi:hypothetical protein A0128_15215 [Leptospira tipperaryensis]|uniref:Uncharacterized protein n=1 Tax=Leptospira tipperaryensis TaxID=2564040 RepID=A0A1D7UZR0_9LEPT|nr:hypothetical protein A0128_15215 [Leptospira tipperaryensis]
MDRKSKLSEQRQSSVKTAGPTLILGGGVGGGKIPETFLYQKILLFASKKSRVGTPTNKYRERFSFQFLSTRR